MCVRVPVHTFGDHVGLVLQLLPGLGECVEVLADGRGVLVPLLDEPVALGADLGDLGLVAINLRLQVGSVGLGTSEGGFLCRRGQDGAQQWGVVFWQPYGLQAYIEYLPPLLPKLRLGKIDNPPIIAKEIQKNLLL